MRLATHQLNVKLDLGHTAILLLSPRIASGRFNFITIHRALGRKEINDISLPPAGQTPRCAEGHRRKQAIV